MSNIRTFKAENGLGLIIKNRKSAVIFEIEVDSNAQENKDYEFLFQFPPEDFKELLEYIEAIANKSWLNLIPKEANSMGADYFEYYDKKLDNNGYRLLQK